MEKRLVVAIALSLLVLLSWSVIMPKTQLVDNKGVIDKSVALSEVPSAKSITLSPSAIVTTPQESVKEPVKFIQNNREIIFNAGNATIVNAVFKDTLEYQMPLQVGFLTNDTVNFKQKSLTKDSISFIYEDQSKRVIKKYFIPKDNYTIELEVLVENLSGTVLVFNPQLVLGRLNLDAKNPQSRYQDVLFSGKEKTAHIAAGKDFNSQDIKFIGLRDQYFCAIVQSADLVSNAYVKKISSQESEIGLFTKEISLKPGFQIGQSYRIYLGPQDLKILNSVNPDWTSIIYFGMFDFIAQLILQLLGFFYSLVHNWGWALIILSVAVYLLLFPLSIKQMRSMKEMQILQPKIEALRKEYKDNPQRLNKEIMELYKEHKVNPLSGCLPLLLQMPIFFALYQALIRSVALRGAHFMWITDLSSPDKLWVFKNSIPLLGNQLNILPILMAIGMFVQQKISMAKTTGETAQQQKIMVIIMPIMFGVIFYQMPSGLVLYWFVNSMLMLGYQFRINAQK